MFTPCLFLVYCLHNETGEGRLPPSCRFLNLFFCVFKDTGAGAQGADRMQYGRTDEHRMQDGPAAPAAGAGSRSREHRSRSKTPKSCSEPDHFRPPPLKKKVVSGPGRQAQNRYITPALRVSDFYLSLTHVQRFNS